MKREVQIIIDYVEGKIDVSEFRQLFRINDRLQKLLKKKIKPRYEAYRRYDYNMYNYLMQSYEFKKFNWDTVETRYTLHFVLKMWLDCFHIPYDNSYTRYSDDYNYILRIQPSWLDITDDQGLFDKILAERPKELSSTKQTEWGKAVLRKMFRYDKTYPRWVQDPEWPIVNGKPLVFSHQSKEKNGDERVYYYFYDPETKKETVITQIY